MNATSFRSVFLLASTALVFTGAPADAGVAAAPEAGPAAGLDLLGKVRKTLFTMTVARLDRDRRSGCTPGDPTFVNQRNEDTFRGDADKTYHVTFRVRGVVEPKVYTGGRPHPANPFVNVGGLPTTDGPENRGSQYVKLRLEVSEPSEVYYLNRLHGDHTDHEVYPMDYRLTVKARGNATVSAVLANGNSCAITNHRDRTVEGLPEDVVQQPFKDQFLYIEAESVVEAQ